MARGWIKGKESKGKESGLSLLAAAIILPVVVVIMTVLVDLARIYLTIIFAQEVSLLTAKIASSIDPQGDLVSVTQLVLPVPGESPQITAKRVEFWNAEQTMGSPVYHGVNYFTNKERKVFNLAYGYMRELDGDVAFPIPYPLTSRAQLGGAVNCTIFFRFNPPLPIPLLVVSADFDRIYYVRCAIPLVSSLLGLKVIDDEFLIVERTGYAYKSGDLTVLPNST